MSTLAPEATRPRDRAVSDFTELTRAVQEAGLMGRRPGHYTARLTDIFEKHGTRGTWYAHASVGCLHVRPILNLKLDKDIKAMRAIATGNAELLGVPTSVLACSSCGVCTNFACNMGLMPSEVMAMLKAELGKAGVRSVPEEVITPDPFIVYKHVPVKRLVARMGLSAYDVPAPYTETAYHPARVVLPLKQHVGAPSVPVVKAGDRVKKGDVIAEIPEKALGARQHASIDGTVTAVETGWIEITGGEKA